MRAAKPFGFRMKAVAALAFATAFMLPAGAAIFEDGEARRAILEMRQRVDALQVSGQRSADEVRRLTDENAQLRRSLLDLQTQIEALRAEDAKMRGQNEQLLRDVSELQRLVTEYTAHAAYEEAEFLPLSEVILGRNSNHMAALGLSLHMRHVKPVAAYI